MSSPMTRRVTLGWLVGWMTAGLIVRLAPSPQVFWPRIHPDADIPPADLPGALPFGSDALYHLRRIQGAVQAYPEIPTWDAWLDYPQGALIPYEPGLDLALAWLARLIGGEGVSPQTVEIVACAAIPLLALMLIPLYTTLCRQLYGPGAARLAAPLLAVLPACAYFGWAGQVDHHFLEPLAMGLPFVPLLSAVLRVERSPQHPDLSNLMILTGLFLGGGFFFWRGQIITASIVAAYLGLRVVYNVWQGRLAPMDIWGGGLVMAVAFAVSLPVCISHPLGRAGMISYFTLSWFQPLFLLALALGLGLLGFGAQALRGVFLVSQRGDRGLGGWALIPALAALAPGVALSWASPSFLEALMGGVGFVGREDSFVLSVSEQLPLFFDFDGSFSPMTALTFFGLLAFLLPVALIALARRPAPRGGILFWLWSAALLALALMQRRYVVLYAPLFVITLAAWVDGILQRAEAEEAHPGRFMPALMALLFMPSLGVYAIAADTPPQPADTVEASLWLRRYTPSAGDHHLPPRDGKAGYGVVAPWSLGHHLSYLARRPAVANPFGIEWFKDGVKRSTDFLRSSDPAASMDALGARFAMVDYAAALTHRQILLEGDNPNNHVKISLKGWAASGPFAHTALARLYLHDGAGSIAVPESVTGMRLIYETFAQVPKAPEGSDTSVLTTPGSAIKIFERVKGAQIIGSARHGIEVTAEVDVITNRGRTFTYVATTITGPSGTFSLQMPYATRGAPRGWAWGQGPVRVTVAEHGIRHISFTNPYTTRFAARHGTASVRDQDVLSGGAVTVDWLNGPGDEGFETQIHTKVIP